MKHVYAILLVLSVCVCHSQVETSNLLCRYNFDGNVNDITNSGLDAIPHGITYVADRFGNPNRAAYFDGVDDYVEFPNVDLLKTPLPVSFTCWIRYDSNDYQHQAWLNTSFEENHCTGVWFNSTAANGNYAVNYGDGSYAYTSETRRTFVSNAVIETGWHHLAIVVTSATDMKIFVDKIAVPGTYNGSGGDLVYSLTPGGIGRHDRNLDGLPDYFQGAIDDFFYYNRSLTQSDVDAIYSLSAHTAQRALTLAAYPNPASDVVLIKSDTPDLITSIDIFDGVGSKVYSGAYSEKIDVFGLSSGLYLLKATGDSQSTAVKIFKK